MKNITTAGAQCRGWPVTCGFGLTYKSFLEKNFYPAEGKCLWYQEHASLEGWKQKQIILVIHIFKTVVKNRFVSYEETTCNQP